MGVVTLSDVSGDVYCIYTHSYIYTHSHTQLTDAIRGRPKQSQPRDPTTVEMVPPVSDTEPETETETEAEPDTIAKV